MQHLDQTGQNYRKMAGVVKASYEVALLVAQNMKAHTIAELLVLTAQKYLSGIWLERKMLRSWIACHFRTTPQSAESEKYLLILLIKWQRGSKLQSLALLFTLRNRPTSLIVANYSFMPDTFKITMWKLNYWLAKSYLTQQEENIFSIFWINTSRKII